MGNIKVDLNKFKYVKGDDHSTTLRHQDGHQITLAHKGLNKDNVTALKALSAVGKNAATDDQHRESKVDQLAEGGQPGLYANIHAKQERIKHGSHEHMRKPGSEGAPTKEAFKESEKTAKMAEGGKVAKYCAYCGGMAHGGECQDEPRKMYEEGSKEPVSKDDNAPETTDVKPEQKGPVVINVGQPAPQTNVAQTPPPSELAPQPQAPAPVQSQVSAPNSPDSSQAPAQGTQPSMPEPETTDVSEAQMAKPADDQEQPVVPARTPEQAYQSIKDELNQKAKATNDDFMQGHIDPKSVESLYGEASTPAKIGALFSIVLGGIGSGLTKQPNAALEMMDKIIASDLEKQKQQFNSKNTFYRLHSMEEPLNEQQIKLLREQGKLTDAQASNALAETGLKTQQNTINSIIMKSFHDQVAMANKMPPGPEKDKRLAALNSFQEVLGAKIADMNDAVAAKVGAMNMMGDVSNEPQAGTPNSQEQQFQNKTKIMKSGILGPTLQKTGEMLAQGHLPGVPEVMGQTVSKGIDPDAAKTVKNMQILDAKAKDVLSFAKANKKNWSKLNPLERNKIIEQGAQKAEELTAFYSKAVDSGVMTKGRMEWLDKQIGKNPTSVFQDVLGNNAKLEEIINSNHGRKIQELKAMGFTPKENVQPVEGQKGVHGPTGKHIIFTNGKWQFDPSANKGK